LSTKLSQEFGDGLDLVLIDQSDSFVFGFSKLDVMFGRARPAGVRHAYRDAVKPGVTFVQAVLQAIDPVAKRVETDVGTFEGDALVVALGADLDPAITPGLIEGGHEFYTVDGAFAAREVIADFDGARAIVFAEGHAAVAAEHIGALNRGTTSSAEYGGRGICYLEFGGAEVAQVDVTFFGDQRTGEFVGPSADLVAEKAEFGSSRIKRWFGRDSTATDDRATAASGTAGADPAR
jgi:hypothetical protein